MKRKITGTLLALLISGSSIAASASTVMGISSEYLPEIEEAVENEDPEDGGSETESIQPVSYTHLPLCSGFRIDSSKIDDTYKDSITDFEINVYEESVQAEGFSDFESAWNYFKNPISADTERSEKLEEIS